jgi:membrane-associated protease RseP (regulator of RpoE activity)
MNKRIFWITLGTGALSIVLIALPGHSAPQQNSSSSSTTQSTKQPTKQSTTQSNSQSNTQKAAPPAEAEPQESTDVEVFENLPGMESVEPDGDGSVHVLIGGHGSWLGVGVQEVTPDKVKELALPSERGALLEKVIPESPAAKAGLQEHDVVTEINGQRVEGTEQFRRMIREIPAGRSVQLTIWRNGHSQNITATLSKPERSLSRGFNRAPEAFAFHAPELPEMPDLSGLQGFHNFSLMSPGQPRLGIDAENLHGDFGNYFGAPDGEGILVRGVLPDSPAAKAGLKAGDVITSADGQRLRSTSELREKFAQQKGDKTIKLGLLRNKTQLSIDVEMPSIEKKLELHLSEGTHI